MTWSYFKKFSFVIVLVLLLPVLSEGRENRALIVGGGCIGDSFIGFSSIMSNWANSLNRLGWQTHVLHGSKETPILEAGINTRPLSRNDFLSVLEDAKSLSRDDQLFLLIATHGLKAGGSHNPEQFQNADSFEDEKNSQVLCIKEDGSEYIGMSLVAQRLNEIESRGVKIAVVNFSCYSGQGLIDLQSVNSKACYAASSDKDTSTFAYSFLGLSGYKLAAGLSVESPQSLIQNQWASKSVTTQEHYPQDYLQAEDLYFNQIDTRREVNLLDVLMSGVLNDRGSSRLIINSVQSAPLNAIITYGQLSQFNGQESLNLLAGKDFDDFELPFASPLGFQQSETLSYQELFQRIEEMVFAFGQERLSRFSPIEPQDPRTRMGEIAQIFLSLDQVKTYQRRTAPLFRDRSSGALYFEEDTLEFFEDCPQGSHELCAIESQKLSEGLDLETLLKDRQEYSEQLENQLEEPFRAAYSEAAQIRSGILHVYLKSLIDEKNKVGSQLQSCSDFKLN